METGDNHADGRAAAWRTALAARLKREVPEGSKMDQALTVAAALLARQQSEIEAFGLSADAAQRISARLEPYLADSLRNPDAAERLLDTVAAATRAARRD